MTFNEAQQEAKDFLAALKEAYRDVSLELIVVGGATPLVGVMHSDLWLVAIWKEGGWFRSYTPLALKVTHYYRFPENAKSLKGLLHEADLKYYCRGPIDALERLAQVKGL